MMEWWSSTPDTRLSQGDILCAVPVGLVSHPAAFLTKRTAAGHGEGWFPATPPDPRPSGNAHFLAKGGWNPVLIVSHSCEIDKDRKKSRVLVCPVRDTTALPADAKSAIFEQRRRSAMPLPDVPNLGDAYADLRFIQVLDGSALDPATQIAQMSDAAVERLHKQLILYFTRLAEE